MKTKKTFAELAKIGMEALAKQGPVTLEQAREQVRWVEEGRKESQR